MLRGLQQQIPLSRAVNDNPAVCCPGESDRGAGAEEGRRKTKGLEGHRPPHSGLLLCRIGPEDPSHRMRGAYPSARARLCVEKPH